jgi:hypothetical protein
VCLTDLRTTLGEIVIENKTPKKIKTLSGMKLSIVLRVITIRASTTNWQPRKKRMANWPRKELTSRDTRRQERANLFLPEIQSLDDLIGPGADPGTVPTDLEQATGIERLEILGKMEGVDIFDMRPLDASRKGTLDNPILVRSAGDEQYAGCTGVPADSHIVHWLGVRIPLSPRVVMSLPLY